MVRLVFRPYTQVRRSICTLESLRTSTRVSPGFVLLRHSSPSFGSQHVCSHSNLSPEGSWSVDSAAEASYLSSKESIHINSALGGSPRALAHMLDSLVRVSRRDDKRHFVKSPSIKRRTPEPIQVSGPIPNNQRSLTCCKPQVTTDNTASHRFHFRYYLTLFSKFFASFPHGTCSLSVSHQYLALDGIYHPLRAAIPNNSTR
jgi:hypothetical protein